MCENPDFCNCKCLHASSNNSALAIKLAGRQPVSLVCLMISDRLSIDINRMENTRDAACQICSSRLVCTQFHTYSRPALFEQSDGI